MGHITFSLTSESYMNSLLQEGHLSLSGVRKHASVLCTLLYVAIWKRLLIFGSHNSYCARVDTAILLIIPLFITEQFCIFWKIAKNGFWVEYD